MFVTISDMRKFAKNYLGDFKHSSIYKIWTSTDTLVHIFKEDIKRFMADIPDYQMAYDKYFKNTIDLVKVYLKDLSTGLHEIDQAFDTIMQVSFF